jgi:hypothetical protein
LLLLRFIFFPHGDREREREERIKKDDKKQLFFVFLFFLSPLFFFGKKVSFVTTKKKFQIFFPLSFCFLVKRGKKNVYAGFFQKKVKKKENMVFLVLYLIFFYIYLEKEGKKSEKYFGKKK